MKTNSILIKEGKACAVCEEIPKEPTMCSGYCDGDRKCGHCTEQNEMYLSALQRVKDNAIFIRPEDQEKAYKTWYRSYGKGIITNTPKEGELYPLSVEVEIFHTCCNGTSTIAYCELDCEGQKHFHGDKTRKLARIVEEPTIEKIDRFIMDKLIKYPPKVEEPEEKLVEIQVQEGLFNGMTPEQLLEWLDKRCGFNSFQKDYVHMILIKMIKAKVTKKDSEV